MRARLSIWGYEATSTSKELPWSCSTTSSTSAGDCTSSTRYAHVLFGITWIGLLYFFNFVQVPSFAEMEAAARSEALRKITKRALWWFRWAAMLTFLERSADVGDRWQRLQAVARRSGLSITLGSILGITMAANVWMVIWPKQQINIASAEAVAAGGEADPAAAGCGEGRRSCEPRERLLLDPDGVLHGVHEPLRTELRQRRGQGRWRRRSSSGSSSSIVWLVAELSALGKLPGGLDSPFCVQILDDHKKVIIAGLVVTAVLYFIGWELAIGS